MSRPWLVDARSPGPHQVTVGVGQRRPQVGASIPARPVVGAHLGSGGGIAGPPGPPGPPFQILGSLDNIGQLPEPGQPGTGWLIDGDLWVWV